MKYKACPASVKAPVPTDDEAPIFEAIVSVFNNKDSMGDIVRPGAFRDTIAAWAKSGDTLPVLWSHRMDDPAYNIGSVTELAELSAGDERIPDWAHPWVKDNGGLWVKAVLDAGPDASPVAKQARRLLTSRRVTQFSYAYDVLDEVSTSDGNELRKLWLYEVSPTQIGANQLTELVAAKAADPDSQPAEKRARPTARHYRLLCDLAAAEHEHIRDN